MCLREQLCTNNIQYNLEKKFTVPRLVSDIPRTFRRCHPVPCCGLFYRRYSPILRRRMARLSMLRLARKCNFSSAGSFAGFTRGRVCVCASMDCINFKRIARSAWFIARVLFRVMIVVTVLCDSSAARNAACGYIIPLGCWDACDKSLM